MKAFVLMSKKTGGLMVGYRISFFDDGQTDFQVGDYKIVLAGHDGWVIEFPPDVYPYPIFFNRDAEKMFTILGEL